MQFLENSLFGLKSQFLQARRRWRDEPASEENWCLLVQSVAWRLKQDQEALLKDQAASKEAKLQAMEALKNLEIKCAGFELQTKQQALVRQDKVKAKYSQTSFQFCDVDEAS